MATWPDDVPVIQDGADGDQKTFNEPIEALTARTDYLKTTVDGLTNKSNLVSYRVNVTTSVTAGDLVYFDADCDCYDRAQALWADAYAVNGEILASPQAYVKGWVITKHTSTSADILLEGLYKSQTLVDSLLGSSADPGIYYLSATDAGKATATVPPLKVPAITYLGSGSIIFEASDVFQPNHLHRTHVLRKTWHPITDSRFDGMDKPSWATMGYDIASDTDFQEWFASYPGAITIFIDGLLQDPNLVVTSTDNIWYMGTYAGSSSSSSSSSSNSTSDSNSTSSNTSSSTSDSSNSSSSSSNTSSSSDSTSSSLSSSSGAGDWPNGADSIVAYNYSPFTNGEPVVRAIGSDTPCELSITSEKGLAKINAMPWEIDVVAATGNAVISVVDKHLKVAPVVTSITSSGGITVTAAGAGQVDISTGDTVQTVIDAELVNLNNAVELTDDPYFYYNFPASRAAAVIGKVAVPRLNSANTYAASAWVYRRGVIGGVTGSTITFPAMTVELTHTDSPRQKSTVVIPAAPEVTTSIAAEANSIQTKLYFGETPAADRITVTPEGTVYVKLSMASDAYDKYITRFGIIIYLVAGTGSVVVPCGS